MWLPSAFIACQVRHHRTQGACMVFPLTYHGSAIWSISGEEGRLSRTVRGKMTLYVLPKSRYSESGVSCCYVSIFHWEYSKMYRYNSMKWLSFDMKLHYNKFRYWFTTWIADLWIQTSLSLLPPIFYDLVTGKIPILSLHLNTASFPQAIRKIHFKYSAGGSRVAYAMYKLYGTENVGEMPFRQTLAVSVYLCLGRCMHVLEM